MNQVLFTYYWFISPMEGVERPMADTSTCQCNPKCNPMFNYGRLQSISLPCTLNMTHTVHILIHICMWTIHYNTFWVFPMCWHFSIIRLTILNSHKWVETYQHTTLPGHFRHSHRALHIVIYVFNYVNKYVYTIYSICSSVLASFFTVLRTNRRWAKQNNNWIVRSTQIKSKPRSVKALIISGHGKKKYHRLIRAP